MSVLVSASNRIDSLREVWGGVVGMAEIYTLLDWSSALLLAGALAMVALTHKEMPIVRLLAVWCGLITVARWIMWSFTTDSNWVLRALAGAVIGAVLLAGIPALWQWTKGRESLSFSPGTEEEHRTESRENRALYPAAQQAQFDEVKHVQNFFSGKDEWGLRNIFDYTLLTR